MRILIVDDDALFLRCTQRRLESRGIDAVTASTAAGALEMMASSTFDAVICDLHMPDMTPDELYDRVRATTPAHRIAFASGGLFTEGDERFALEHEVLLKPFRIDAIIGVAARTQI